jgi:putative ABC transport system permease protein
MWWPFRRTAREDDLEQEIRTHLAIETERRIERGETPQEAAHSARRDFGNIGLVKEVTRDMWGFAPLESVVQDLKYAIRGMRHNPAFTLTAVLILALGIGANASIFSIIDAALLRPLPFPNSDRLVTITSTRNGAPIGAPSLLDIRDMRAASQCFEDIVLYDHWRKNVSGIANPARSGGAAGQEDAPEEAVVGLVPGAYFELLGIKPLLGRIFSEEENVYGRHYVVAISERFWKTRFAADPHILDRTLRINGETYAVVAVMPDVIPRWMDRTGAPVSIWTPHAPPDALTEATRGDRGNFVLGRLKPGVSYRQAQAELATLAARLAQEHVLDRGVSAVLDPLADTRAGPIRPVLLLLWAAVGAVLAIACANLASLLLARNSARAREMAVRAVLGAGRPRLIRQMLVETSAISLAGGIAGLGFSALAQVALARINVSRALPYTTASDLLRQFSAAAPQSRVLLFTLAVSVLTAILFGLAPAFAGSRAALAETLKEGGRTGSEGPSRQRFRGLLVAAEIALSVVLAAGAAGMLESMLGVWRADPGFRPDHLLISHIYIPPARYPDPAAISRFCETFVRRVRTLAGVVDASVTTGYPPVLGWRQWFTIPGVPVPRFEDTPTARFANVDEHYRRTMSYQLVAGRDLAEADSPTSPFVALVNQAFERHYFPNQSAIGREISPGLPPGIAAPALQSFGGSSRKITIVGVVRDFMNNGVVLPPDPLIITLFRQEATLNFGFKDLVVRTAVDPESIAPAVSRELKSLDPDLPLGEIRTMEEHMSNQTADKRLTTILLGTFAGLGTILAVVGVYGVVAYLVAQRTRELGVRVALGATPVNILWLVLRQGLLIGILGVGVGITAAIALRQVFLRQLSVQGSADSSPFAIPATAIAVLLAIVLASLAPARRAMRVDTVQALRADS